MDMKIPTDRHEVLKVIRADFARLGIAMDHLSDEQLEGILVRLQATLAASGISVSDAVRGLMAATRPSEEGE